MTEQPITAEALAALALARHVREIAVESGADSGERIGPDTLDEWREMYACALTWATAPSDEDDDLEYTVYVIASNIAGKRWRSDP